MINIEVTDADVKAGLEALQQRVNNMGPCLKEIGEDVAERATRRFETKQGPDGTPWKPNAESTINAYLMRRSGEFAAFSHVLSRKIGTVRVGNKKGYFKKDGGLAAKGQKLVGNKSPLMDTGGLAGSIRYQIVNGGTSVEVGTNWFSEKILSGAAIHQFGGQAGKGRKVKIPARPFLPVTESGQLYPDEKAMILESINRYLALRY